MSTATDKPKSEGSNNGPSCFNIIVVGLIGAFLFCCMCYGCGGVSDLFSNDREPIYNPNRNAEATPRPQETEDLENLSGSISSNGCRIDSLELFPQGPYLPSQTVAIMGETVNCDRISVHIFNTVEMSSPIIIEGEDKSNFVGFRWNAPNGTTTNLVACIYGDGRQLIDKCPKIIVDGPESYVWNGVIIVDGGGDCSGAYEPRMRPGVTGVVTPGEPSKIWSGPGSSEGQVIAKLPAGTEFEILGNPICKNAPGMAGGYLWYPVRVTAAANWILEPGISITVGEDRFVYMTEGRPDQGPRGIAPK
jgi:hypothetical protein